MNLVIICNSESSEEHTRMCFLRHLAHGFRLHLLLEGIDAATASTVAKALSAGGGTEKVGTLAAVS